MIEIVKAMTKELDSLTSRVEKLLGKVRKLNNEVAQKQKDEDRVRRLLRARQQDLIDMGGVQALTGFPDLKVGTVKREDLSCLKE